MVMVMMVIAVDFPPISMGLIGGAAFAHPRQKDPGLGCAGLVDGDVGVHVEAPRHVSTRHHTYRWLGLE